MKKRWEDIQTASKNMEKCPTLLVIREMHFKITMRYHYTHTRVAVTKEKSNSKC